MYDWLFIPIPENSRELFVNLLRIPLEWRLSEYEILRRRALGIVYQSISERNLFHADRLMGEQEWDIYWPGWQLIWLVCAQKLFNMS